MYNLKDLKDVIEVKEDKIVCPVLNCKNEVKRIRKGGNLKHSDFLCLDHNIYISPSTFEYTNELSNLILLDQTDKELYSRIKHAKRECRIARERSEDALTWNIFRHLEKQKYIEPFIKEALGINIINPELILWSFSEKEIRHSKGVLKKLCDARSHFGEIESHSTEPDIIIKGENTLVFIEAKFSSGNNTSGNQEKKSNRIINSKNYNSDWFRTVFNENYETLIRSGKYELMRLWLFGTWIANQNKLTFTLVNLTREKYEQAIEKDFKPLINENETNWFKRITWESIYDFLLARNQDSDRVVLEYFENKTCGFNSSRKIQKAFNRE